VRDWIVWLLLALLLVSNAAWVATRPDAHVERSDRGEGPEFVATRMRVERLEHDVQEARAAAAARDRDLEEARAQRERRAAERQKPQPDPWQRHREVSRLRGPWQKALLQVEDADLRTRTLAELREVLHGDDPVRIQAALNALGAARNVRFDRGSFRPEVERHLSSDSPPVRAAAIVILAGLPRAPGDLETVLAFVEDPAIEVRRSMMWPLLAVSGYKLEGAAGEAALKLLAEEDLIDRVIRSMTGSRLSPALEKRVLELAAQPKWRQAMYHFVLAGVGDPSDAVMDALIEGALGKNGEVRGSAFHALWHVAPRHRERVADALLQLIEREKPPSYDALTRLEKHGSERHAAALERLIASDHFDERLRGLAERAVKTIRRRSR